MKNRILVVIDMQKGFVCNDGNLTIQAEHLIPVYDRFFRNVPKGLFSNTLLTIDTHFLSLYESSAEGQDYPYHCGYKTQDGALVIHPQLLSGKTCLWNMTKDETDMWSPKPQGAILKTPDEQDAYQNLYLPCQPQNHIRMTRHQWLAAMGFEPTAKAEQPTVVMGGVATDICFRGALNGFLKLGANTVILSDLVHGFAIQLDEMMKEPQYAKYIKAGKLRIMKSDEYLASCQPKPRHPSPKPKR